MVRKPPLKTKIEPRKTKRWIDPKKSVSYEVVERSTDDVLLSTSGASQNVLRVVKDTRTNKSRAEAPTHSKRTDDNETPISAATSSGERKTRAKKAAASSSIFEDDDDDVIGSQGSEYSDEESFEGDDESSGIGSEDDYPQEDELDEELQRHVRSAAPREAGWVQTKSKSKPTRSFVRGGYDYGQHMKDTGAQGAVYVSKDGKVTAIGEEEEEKPKKLAGPQLLPAELFASKPTKEAVIADQHDKTYGLLEDIDPEIQAMLDSSSSEDGDTDDENALDDDFVMQAIKPAEGEEEIDIRAYLDNIIRTGKLPHELDDPFGEDGLEDIESYLDSVTVKQGQKGGKQFGGKKSQPGAAPSGSLDDIDDDIDMVAPKTKGPVKQQGGRKVHFESGEEDEEDEEMEEYDSDMFEEDEEMDEIDRRASQMGAIPGGVPMTAEEAARALHRFETALADYDETMEIEEDDPLAKGSKDVNDFEDVLDEFIDEAVVLGLRPATAKSEIARRKEREGIEKPKPEESKKSKKKTGTYDPIAFARKFGQAEEGADVDEYEEVEEEQGPQWDVESYVSTYTNTENHPRVIQHSALDRRIQIGKGGVPTGVLKHERKLNAKEQRMRQKEADEAYLASREANKTRVDTSVGRPKDETPEQRKARKEAVKLEKKVNREVKRQLKDSFKTETVRQQRAEAHNSRATIVHL